VTFQNIGKRLAIVMDGQVYSAPVIRDRIPNGALRSPEISKPPKRAILLLCFAPVRCPRL
jgi:preprotein translocase subunit SecD